MVMHSTFNRVIMGSSPIEYTKLGLSSAGRIFDFDSKGPTFDPSSPSQALLAQLDRATAF